MTVETLNGNGAHPKGRAAPPLPVHLFKDSGVVAKLRKIAPHTQSSLLMQLQRENPRPEPPIVQTEIGPEANPADPDYERRVEAWQREISQELNARLFKLAALECEVEIDHAVIAQKKAHLAAIGLDWHDDERLTDDENDRVFFITHIACATPEDMGEFYQAVTRRSQPSEEAVQAWADTFPGDVSGP